MSVPRFSDNPHRYVSAVNGCLATACLVEETCIETTTVVSLEDLFIEASSPLLYTPYITTQVLSHTRMTKGQESFAVDELNTVIQLVGTSFPPSTSKPTSDKQSSNAHPKGTNTMSTEDATKQMAAMSVSKGTAKRDALRSNEHAVQEMWEKEGAFEVSPDPSKESFMVTFPYPYSNGHLHIGHAFSLTKAIFRAQFERHLGKNVLFPFAFHCTGMPIQAVSIRTRKTNLFLFCFFGMHTATH